MKTKTKQYIMLHMININNVISSSLLDKQQKIEEFFEERKPRYSKKQIALAAIGAAGLTIGLYQSGAVQWTVNTLRSWFVNDIPGNLDDVESTGSFSTPSLDDADSSGNDSLQMKTIRIFTSYTTDNPERLSLSRKVANNHSEYCTKHGYDYKVYERNLADLGYFDTSLPYWSKIAGINEILAKRSGKELPSWIVWLDDDAIVLNESIKMDEFIHNHGGSDPNTHVIITSDVPHAGTKVNTGVLMVRNSEESKRFFNELFQMRHKKIYKNSGWTTYSQCPNQICLHEQEAMHDLLNQQPEYRKIVKIIPQTDENGIGVNTFERFNHIDDRRNMYLNYNGDPASSRCKPQDFICQCTGLATRGRRDWNDQPSNLREECIDGLLKKVK